MSKLLLTSQGFTNQQIINALQDMLEQSISQSRIVVVATASLYSEHDKTWWIDVLHNVRMMNWGHVDIIDVLALDKSNWLPKIDKADVVFFTGDDASHLLRGLIDSGLGMMLSDLSQSKILVGNSAGNAVLGPDLMASNKSKRVEYGQLHNWVEPDAACGIYTDFYVTSHYKSLKHPRDESYVRSLAATLEKDLYAISDENAVIVIDNEFRDIVGSGEYLIVKK